MCFLSKCPVSVLPFYAQGSKCNFLRRYFGLLISLNVNEHVSTTPEDWLGYPGQWSPCWSLSFLLSPWSKYFPCSGDPINFERPSGSPFRRFFFIDYICLMLSPSWASNNSRPGGGCKSRLKSVTGCYRVLHSISDNFWACFLLMFILSPSWASNNSRPGRGCKSRLEQLGGASSRASCP